LSPLCACLGWPSWSNCRSMAAASATWGLAALADAPPLMEFASCRCGCLQARVPATGSRAEGWDGCSPRLPSRRWSPSLCAATRWGNVGMRAILAGPPGATTITRPARLRPGRRRRSRPWPARSRLGAGLQAAAGRERHRLTRRRAGRPTCCPTSRSATADRRQGGDRRLATSPRIRTARSLSLSATPSATRARSPSRRGMART